MSVIVPVYNAGPYLEPCLESLLAQDLARDEFEVVAVDDGSTDGSGEVLDRYTRSHPHFRVIHQENSGWPGRPRNVGTRAARGDFVFYLDADDTLAPDALRRMLRFAREHGSDLVVVGRVTVEGGHVLHGSGNARVLPDAPLPEVFRSLTPHKLIRRTLLLEHDLRFPEGKVTYEDGIFLAEVAPRAGRISVLGDRGYYIKRKREDEANISRQRFGRPRQRVESVARIVDTVRALHDDRWEADTVALRLYRRLLETWSPQRVLGRPRANQERWVGALSEFAETRIDPALDLRLPRQLHLHSLAFRTGDVDAVVAVARWERDRRLRGLLRAPVLLRLMARMAYRRGRRGLPAKARRAAGRARRRLRRG